MTPHTLGYGPDQSRIASYGLETSNLSHIVACGKANKFLTSKFKGEGQGHVKGQNNISGHNFCSF